MPDDGAGEWPLFERDGAEAAPDAEGGSAPVYLAFDLAGQTLAVPVTAVREIVDRREMIRLPGAPEDVAGLVDLRGASVPIVDIDRRLGLPPRDRGPDARTVVFDFQDGPEPFVVGIDADRVRSVLPIPEAAVEPCPKGGLGPWDARMLRGIHREGGAMIVLLDPREMFGAPSA